MVIFLGLLTALTACHGAGSSTSPSPIATTFVLTGTLREADETPIAGATVKVAELPGLSAQTGPDGTYDLQVSDGTRFTPYADAVGHHRIALHSTIVTTVP